jgi:hypothetical protein
MRNETVEVQGGAPVRTAGGLLVLFFALALRAVAGTDNGNTLCLDYVSANGPEQKTIRQESSGKLYFFRYLRIDELEKGTTNGMPFVAMSTVEPSSDMVVRFTVVKSVSLGKCKDIAEGDAIAVTGRLVSMGVPENTVLLDPVIVRYKDRSAPKIGKELLHEVDPDARRGTDTSTGEEKVLK